MKAPVFEEKIVDHIIANSNVTDKIVSVEELYNFNDEAKPAKKSAKKETKAEGSETPKAKETKKTAKKSA